MSLKDCALTQPGERTNGEGKPVANKILLAIPQAEFDAVRLDLRHVIFARHRSLHEPKERTKFAYFPNDGLLSLVVLTEDGRTVEAGIVGKEGVIGMASIMGLMRNPLREIVQIDVSGFRVEVEALRRALRSSPEFQMTLGRYAVLHGLQVSQTAACNRLHPTEKRLARWLLMTQDRIGSGLLKITHDFLATMLGTDRPTVTLAARRLQKKGLLQYSRGAVRILNRKRLEKASCECYGVVQEFNGDLGLT